LRRSDSIRNRLQPRPKVPNYGGPKVGITGAVRCNFVLKSPAAGNGIFGCRDRAPKSPLKCANVGRDQNPGSKWPEIPRNALFGSRIGNVRFAKTGWWCAQSHTNPSPLNSLLNRERTGKFPVFQGILAILGANYDVNSGTCSAISLSSRAGKSMTPNREFFCVIRERRESEFGSCGAHILRP
jgi:hypothetical protein